MRPAGRPPQMESHDLVKRMEAELQLGHHPKASATGTATGPEQICVFARAGAQGRAFSGHDLQREKLITGKPKFSCQKAVAAAENEPGDTYGGTSAGWDGEPLLRQELIDIPERRSRAACGGRAFRVCLDCV